MRAANGPVFYNPDLPTIGEYGADYVNELLRRSGVNPDVFEGAGASRPSQPVTAPAKPQRWTDKLVKWTGITFAGLLGLIFAKRTFFPAAEKMAKQAAQAVTQTLK